jgi:NNP family nitrate/nitrite transporter-like MFS transporter
MPPISLGSRVLITNTLSFAAAVAAWVALGPATRTVAQELQLTPTSATLLKVAPILVGSVLRVPIGIATDRFGARDSSWALQHDPR